MSSQSVGRGAGKDDALDLIAKGNAIVEKALADAQGTREATEETVRMTGGDR